MSVLRKQLTYQSNFTDRPKLLILVYATVTKEEELLYYYNNVIINKL